jgi:hypothetical protein
MVNKGSTRGKNLEKKQEILKISEEISLVQKLADNDVKVRDRAMKKLRNWIEAKSKNGGKY